jgi:hypothetical protein
LSDFDKIDKEQLRKMDRAARRNALKKDGGQDKLRTRAERNKKKYVRKKKHKKNYGDEYQELLEELDEDILELMDF